MTEPKPFLTYTEQLDKIVSRGMTVENPTQAIKVLQRTNYYRLTSYFLPFRNKSGNYKAGVKFEDICQLYEFDRELRLLIFSYLEKIEIFIKTTVAYEFSQVHGELGYLDKSNFNKRHDSNKFREIFEREVRNNRTKIFVQHHLSHYSGKFPLWVAVELFTFGMISRFFADMNTDD